METLNVLLKKAITTLNGITYQLWVIKTDNTKGEMVVEIEIKKGTVIKTVNFTIVGFKTTTKAILNEEARTLDESNFYYDGKAFDMSKDASFYDDKAKVSGVKLSKYTLLTASQVKEISKATLKITYTLKNGQTSSDTQTFSYSGFNKLQAQKDDDVAIAKAVLDKLGDTTILDQSKTPSQVSYDNVADFFKKTALDAPSGEDTIALRKVDITIEVVARSSNAQTIEFTIKSRPVGKIDKATLRVNQFKEEALAQNEADVGAAKVVLANLANTNILDDSQIASQISYGNLADFFDKTALDAPSGEDATALSKVTITIAQTIKDDTSQIITFTINSNPSGASDTSQLEVTGFKSQDQVDADVALAKISSATINGDSTKLPSQMSAVLIKALPSFPTTTSNGVHFSVVFDNNNNDINSELTFTLIAKKNDQRASKEITIRGFKELNQDQKDVAIIKKYIDDHGHGTIKDQTKFADEMSFFESNRKIWNVINFAEDSYYSTSLKPLSLRPEGFSDSFKRVTLTNKEEVDSKDDTKKILTTTIISKNGAATATSITIISGFASRKQAQLTIDAAKALLDKLDQGTINSNTNSASQVTYKDIADLIEQTSLENFNAEDQAIIDQVTITIATEPKDDTSQTVTLTIAKRRGSSVTSTIVISGFASQSQVDITNALAKIANDTIKGDSTKLPSQMDMSSIKALSGFPPTSNGVHFDIKEKTLVDSEGIHYDMSGKLIIILKASKNGIHQTKELTISGFQTRPSSAYQSDVNEALVKIINESISGDNSQLPSAMDANLVKALSGFPAPLTNGVHFDVEIKTLSANDGTSTDISGELIITLRASISGESQTKEIIISGFKRRPLTQDESDVADNLAKVTISGDLNKLPSTMDVDSIKTLAGFPPSSNGVDFDVEIVKSNNINDQEGTLIITLIATKNDAIKKRELTINGFQTQALADKKAVDNYQASISKVSQTTTKTNRLLSSAVRYNSVANFNGQTNVDLALPPSNIKVVITSKNTDGQQVVTFTISKGVQEASHKITVTAFQTQAQARVQANVNRAKRDFDHTLGRSIVTRLQQYSTQVTYDSFQDFVDKVSTQNNLLLLKPILEKMTITFEVVSTNATSQTVTATISQEDASATSTFEVIGFKPQAK